MYPPRQREVMSKHTYTIPSAFRSLPIMVLAALFTISLTSCTSEEEVEYGTTAEAVETAVNTLTEAEQAEGWQLLFDGESFEGWRGIGREDVPAQHWEIVDGAIHKIASG